MVCVEIPLKYLLINYRKFGLPQVKMYEVPGRLQ